MSLCAISLMLMFYVIVCTDDTGRVDRPY